MSCSSSPPRRRPPQIKLDLGTWESFLEEMQRQLPLQEVPGRSPENDRPLEKVALDGPENWITSLLDAWAVVGDILSFYQERIVNEGYLATATESLSLHQMVQSIAVPPRPATSPVLHLAFSMAKLSNIPPEMTVPARLRIQSLPAHGQPPQIFETAEPLMARHEWNQLKTPVEILTVPDWRGPGGGSLRLAGAQASIQPGAAILIVSSTPAPSLISSPSSPPSPHLTPLSPPSPPEPEVRLLRTVIGNHVKKVPKANLEAATQQAKAVKAAGGTPGPPPPAQLTELDLDTPVPQLDRPPQIFLLRRSSLLFGNSAQDWTKLSVQKKRLFSEILGGISTSSDGGAHWQQANQDLPAETINVLSFVGEALLAGTQVGVFRKPSLNKPGSKGQAWETLIDGIGSSDVRSLAVGDDDQLFAGTIKGGVYRAPDGKTWEPLVGRVSVHEELHPPSPGRRRVPRLPRAVVRAILPLPGSQDVLVGTDYGVFQSGEENTGWLPLNEGLPEVDPETAWSSLSVYGLTQIATYPAAATSRGIFVFGWSSPQSIPPAHAFSPPSDESDWTNGSWSPLGTWPPTGQKQVAPEVFCLLAEAKGAPPLQTTTVHAGTADGIYTLAGGTWKQEAGSSGYRVTALAQAGTTLYAATDAGLLTWTPNATAWTLVPVGAPDTQVDALATRAQSSDVAVANPFDGFQPEQWPGYHLRSGQIDLASTQKGVAPEGWVVLSQSSIGGSPSHEVPFASPFSPPPWSPQATPPPDPGSPAAEGETLALQIHEVATERRQDFGLTAMVTRLLVEPDPWLETFDLRRTVALFGSQELEPMAIAEVSYAPIAGSPITLAELVEPPLPALRPIHITGQLARIEIDPSLFPIDLETDNGKVTLGQAAGETFRVLDADLESGVVRRLSTDDDIEGVVELAPGEFQWRAAKTDDSTVGQVTLVLDQIDTVRSFDTGQPPIRVSALKIDPPLLLFLDPETVAIHANSVQATQGESVREILGSGNGAATNQTFALSKWPLTHLPADTASGAKPALKVQIEHVTWSLVASFRDSGPSDQVYTLQRDLSGRSTVTFGDGIHGARLPTGHNNVVASYRSGFWPEPLTTGQISLPRSRSLGLKSVTNPAPTSGGTPPESSEGLRKRIPQATASLARLVGPSDYESFVLSFPQITRAQLALFHHTSTGKLAQITVAGVDGSAVKGTDLENLQQAIETSRSPGPRIEIDSYVPQLFNVKAALKTTGSYSFTEIEKNVAEALQAHFGFVTSEWGGIVTPSDLLVTILAVEGVEDASIVAFYAREQPPTIEDSLQARPAQWDPKKKQVSPAGLLLISDKGILLTEDI